MELNDLLLNLIDLCLNVHGEVSMLLGKLTVLLVQSSFDWIDNGRVFDTYGVLGKEGTISWKMLTQCLTSKCFLACGTSRSF